MTRTQILSLSMLALVACSAGGGANNTGDQTDPSTDNGDDTDHSAEVDVSGDTNSTSGSSGPSTGGSSSTTTSGAAGATGNTLGSGGSGGSGGGSSVQTGGSAGSTTGGAAGAASDANAPYPPGPYGIQKGQIVPNICWQGYNEQGTEAQVCTRDFYDPTGSRNINAVVFDTSGIWCGNCQAESHDLRTNMAAGGAAVNAGVHWVVLVYQNGSRGTATFADATWWKNNFFSGFAGNVSITAAPQHDLFPGGGVPYNVAVDTHTMKIIEIWPGYNSQLVQVTTKFAQGNVKH